MGIRHQIGQALDTIGMKKRLLICYDKYIDIKMDVDYLRNRRKDLDFMSHTPFPDILSIDDTLDFLIEHRMSVCRYGDGEFNLMQNRAIGFQKPSKELSLRLAEIVQHPPKDMLVCIPGIMTRPSDYTWNTRRFWNRILVHERPEWYKHLNFTYQYGNADMTRCYIGLSDKSKSECYFRKLKSLWEEKDILLVEGEQSRLGVGNDLFGKVKSINRILCPAMSAFDRYDQILATVVKYTADIDLVLLALGPTATVLACDLCERGIRVLDIGNVDNEYDWFITGAKKKTRNPMKFSMEVKDGGITEKCLDYSYLSQIVEKIY